MKGSKLLSLVAPLFFLVAPSLFAAQEGAVRVEVQEDGSVVFETQAEEGGLPRVGLRVQIDGKAYGRVGEDGKLHAKGLPFGPHAWSVESDDEKPLSGVFEVPRISKASIERHWFEDKETKKELDAFSIRQGVFLWVSIKNTGTVPIKEWEIWNTCPGLTTCADVKLTRPSLPGWLTKPVISIIFKDLRLGRKFKIEGGKLKVANVFANRTSKPGKVFIRGELPKEGLKPGDTLDFAEDWTYAGWMGEYLENLGIDKKIKGGLVEHKNYEITDPKKGIIEGSIEEYKIAGVTKHDVGFRAKLRGLEDCCTLRLLVDGKESDQRSMQACYRVGKGLVED
jgi:hypothetical protein